MILTFSTFLVFAFGFLQFREGGGVQPPTAARPPPRRGTGPPRGGQAGSPSGGSELAGRTRRGRAASRGPKSHKHDFFLPDQNTMAEKKIMLVRRPPGGAQA